ncbi:MAG TPA: cation diffusion facilitator family transporter [Chloroflexota bacterium]|nr:cation diffusion facilitator family transporter [Chloroflexota bacterium]
MPHVRWALLSIGAAVATIVLKLLAFWLTGSVAMLSDALESLVNLAAAVVLLFALWFGSLPPDETHSYGHEKVEFFASGFEGALILFAAGGILATAVPRLVAPAPIAHVGLGIAASVAASVVNLVTARLLLAQAKRTRSLALESDGRHLLSDVFTTAGVIAGVAVTALTGIALLDPLIALVVGLLILRTGADLLRRSVHGLMDRALDEDEVAALRDAIQAQLGADMTFHQLRTRRVGPRRLADVHLLVPGERSVRDGHALATAVEQAVHRALPDAELTVHVEPVEGERGPGHLPAREISPPVGAPGEQGPSDAPGAQHPSGPQRE